MSSKCGKFISFEGGEGAGKSTQAALLFDYLKGIRLKALITREPGGTPVAEKIRSIILDKGNDMALITEAVLYCAARAEHLSRVILPALERGVYVICDRFSDSTTAYQAYGRGLSANDIERLNDIATNGVKPDATVFLDIPPNAGFLRKGGADDGDRMESAGREFHERVYNGFCAIAAAEPRRVLRIDALRGPEEVHRAIVAGLKERKII